MTLSVSLPVCVRCLSQVVFATLIHGAPYCRICAADMGDRVPKHQKREDYRGRKPNRRSHR